jgi:hypothetical protein
MNRMERLEESDDEPSFSLAGDVANREDAADDKEDASATGDLEQKSSMREVNFAETDEEIPHDVQHHLSSSRTSLDNDLTAVVQDVEMGIPAASNCDGNNKSDQNITQRNGRRLSLVTDLSTGMIGGARGHFAQIRPDIYSTPCPSAQRKRMQLRSFFFKRSTSDVSDDAMSNNSQHTSKHGRYVVSRRDILESMHEEVRHSCSPQLPKQYCLKAVQPRSSSLWWWLGCAKNTRVSVYEASGKMACLCCGINPNMM